VTSSTDVSTGPNVPKFGNASGRHEMKSGGGVSELCAGGVGSMCGRGGGLGGLFYQLKSETLERSGSAHVRRPVAVGRLFVDQAGV